MKKFHLLKLFTLAFAVFTISVGCVHDDDYALPPIECNDFTDTKTISDIKALYTGSTTEITEDYVLEGYVVSSDETGNIYKTLYIQDAPENPTSALTVSVDASDMYTKFPVGSKIFIKVKGLYLGAYGGVIQLGGMTVDENGAAEFGRISSTNFENKFFKGCENYEIKPVELSLSEVNDDLIGALVQLKDVEFVDGVLGTTFASYQTTVNKNIEDCTGRTILLRNSGYSTFYNVPLPEGKGPMTAILSKYNSDYQLYIRGVEDTAGMTGKRCHIFKDSFDNFSNWSIVNVVGPNQYWKISSQGASSNYAIMNGFSGSAIANEDWIVSKEIDLSDYSNVTLSFRTDVRYNGNALQVFLTDNYTGDVATTTWDTVDATIDTNTGAWGFVSSGDVNLDAYAGKKVRLAFKYTSDTSNAATWEVDDVVFTGN